MRRLILGAVATAMLTVTGASANSYSCDKETLTKHFLTHSKANQVKIEKILKNKDELALMSIAQSVGQIFDSKYGSLQNNITNLQLPTSTLSIVNNWGSVFFKVYSYFKNSKNEKELYYRLSQFTQYLLPSINKPLILASSQITTGDSYSLGNELIMLALRHKNKEMRRNSLRSLVMYALIADPTADDSFAKKYFSKHDDVTNCVKQAIGL